ncbi:unnamed protein product [Protopolystoma xenopodis]|uniref:Uncharacterized protein n=1 Tax=Protopolystoma xenopodis TaxID=117903 RepID=A0A448XHW2_9PLAT|nr:unnamed protein product [Protopolystoma xenopodis]
MNSLIFLFYCCCYYCLTPNPDNNTDEEHSKSIQLDRPARELLIWSILVGKLRMAELFWTMEKVRLG